MQLIIDKLTRTWSSKFNIVLNFLLFEKTIHSFENDYKRNSFIFQVIVLQSIMIEHLHILVGYAKFAIFWNYRNMNFVTTHIRFLRNNRHPLCSSFCFLKLGQPLNHIRHLHFLTRCNCERHWNEASFWYVPLTLGLASPFDITWVYIMRILHLRKKNNNGMGTWGFYLFLLFWYHFSMYFIFFKFISRWNCLRATSHMS